MKKKKACWGEGHWSSCGEAWGTSWWQLRDGGRTRMRVLGVVGERASERTGARPRSRDRGRGDRCGERAAPAGQGCQAGVNMRGPLICPPTSPPEIPTTSGPLAGLSWTWNFESHSLPTLRARTVGTGATEPAGTGKGGRHRSPAAPSLPWT